MRKIERASQIGSNSVGAIAQSFLSEAAYQEINGVSWILCDGRNVAGSQYAIKTGNSSVPNATGLVLRTVGIQSVGGANKVGPTLGGTQDDRMQGHRHPYLTSSLGGGAIGGGSTFPTNAKFTSTVENPTTDGANGAPRTGAETRVAALGVNTFIKIN